MLRGSRRHALPKHSLRPKPKTCVRFPFVPHVTLRAWPPSLRVPFMSSSTLYRVSECRAFSRLNNFPQHGAVHPFICSWAFELFPPRGRRESPAATNTCVCALVRSPVSGSFGIYPGVELLGQTVFLCLIFFSLFFPLSFS